jgi:3-isopropylmalate/(R)-2-methylmalate dehydratase large subunit
VVANPDHNTPTDHWDEGIKDPISRLQVETLDANIRDFGALVYFPFKHANQGIIHVIGPENGTTLPGMTVVCGDSHTSTHGAFGALAHGIGTSEVEHVLATQTLVAKRSRRMLIKVDGKVGPGVTAKDIALAIIGKIGTAGGTGYAVEFGGSAIRDLIHGRPHDPLQHGHRGGARAGLVAPDEKTFEYLKGRQFAPKGATGTRPSPTGRRCSPTPAPSSTP